MVDIAIVNGAYKPTNITGGHHPVGRVEEHPFTSHSALNSRVPLGHSTVEALRPNATDII
jgi:hypothetical protein